MNNEFESMKEEQIEKAEKEMKRLIMLIAKQLDSGLIRETIIENLVNMGISRELAKALVIKVEKEFKKAKKEVFRIRGLKRIIIGFLSVV